LPYLPESRFVPVIVDCPAERDERGAVRQRGRAKLTVRQGTIGTDFAALFAGTEVIVSRVADFKSAAWRKLCLNSAGIINALLLEPAGAFRDERIAAVALQIVRECAEVGRAEGATLAADLPEEVIERCCSAPPDAVNSMHADRVAGRPMEIDARNGAIVRLGRRHGIATPANQLAVALLERMGLQGK
jgi:2-dehydropantoate 2-reductase